MMIMKKMNRNYYKKTKMTLKKVLRKRRRMRKRIRIKMLKKENIEGNKKTKK
jgi:hypothetical protein